ncbi:hypothetical protein EVAR_40415_1 [Eumeta japonica]|uniref:Uncharacterized protein n=1 Tax=Eumeta variegata TaxID=151549 RepID=A0A4C1WAC7_EUMVA|nr:hypothetical protein EVAR_40415_1 [Eumeta japonica]
MGHGKFYKPPARVTATDSSGTEGADAASARSSEKYGGFLKPCTHDSHMLKNCERRALAGTGRVPPNYLSLSSSHSLLRCRFPTALDRLLIQGGFADLSRAPAALMRTRRHGRRIRGIPGCINLALVSAN